MIKTVGCLLAGALAASAWTVNAEAQRQRGPDWRQVCGGASATERGDALVYLGTGQAVALISFWFRKCY